MSEESSKNRHAKPLIMRKCKPWSGKHGLPGSDANRRRRIDALRSLRDTVKNERHDRAVVNVCGDGTNTCLD